MPGFSGATGVPLKQMQDAIAQSTANKTIDLKITTDDNTIAKIYTNYLGTIDVGTSATFNAPTAAASLLTGNNYSAGFIKGYLHRATVAGAYDFIAINAGGTRMFSWRLTITNGTSGAVTGFTEYANTQSTANLMKSGTWTPVIQRATIATLTRATWYRTGNLVFASATFTTGALPSGVSASDNVYIEQSSYPTGGGTGVADTSVVDGVWENATSAIGGIIASSGINNNGWFFGTIMTTDYETHRLRADKLVNSTITIHLRYAVNV